MSLDVTVIVAFPGFIAVISPIEETETTDSSLELHVTSVLEASLGIMVTGLIIFLPSVMVNSFSLRDIPVIFTTTKILHVPITVPASFVAVIFALIVALAAIFFSFFICGIAFAISGLAGLVASCWAFSSSVTTAVFYFGFALFIIPIGILIIIGISKLSKITFLGIQKKLGNFLIKKGTSKKSDLFRN